ncbi:CYTH and CHAD domain-containing protein [Mesorhizobium jarvisii]|uniref:CYTH and CHAD domain-containing protein n=1 Tax=Mesorhizobium jarvisii TaxID=1777867 RepID=UPI001F0A4A94|nr:CYTH and CHAD domain-containing protein [Mesorhizobium jarvisii]MCH4561148.1 CHAD domain-containing protein [Mesorhizobium jarvisii]
MDLKLQLPQALFPLVEDVPIVRQVASAAKTKQLDSVYFDTDKFKLREVGISLRVRSGGRNHVQTIKCEPGPSSDLTTRGEWETEIKGTAPDLDGASDTPLKRLLSKKFARALKPVFETRTQRKTLPIKTTHASMELALDHCWITTGDKSEEVCEIEIELKQGDRTELFELARTLAKAAPLRLSVRSKAERGYGLIDGKPAQAVLGGTMPLQSGENVATAFQKIAESCLRQIAANWEAVNRGDPEGIHQMRVGLRRLLAAMSLFSQMLSDRQCDLIKAELKWLMGELTQARELHVFSVSVLPHLRDAYAGDNAFKMFEGKIDRLQSLAEARARAAIETDRFRSLLLDTAEWIHDGEWIKTDDALRVSLKEQIIDKFARQTLSSRTSKIMKRARKLDDLGAWQRHKLRIAAKKLRYGSEFFEGLFASGPAKRRRKSFLHALEALQDYLGNLNDIAGHIQLCRSMAEAPLPEADANAWQIAFFAGVASNIEERRLEKEMRSNTRIHRQLNKTKPFWI